jgi:hypothetical protein
MQPSKVDRLVYSFLVCCHANGRGFLNTLRNLVSQLINNGDLRDVSNCCCGKYCHSAVAVNAKDKKIRKGTPIETVPIAPRFPCGYPLYHFI